MPNAQIHNLDHTPASTDFIPLSSHQEQTPTTFFYARPVLHYTLGECDVLLSRADIERHAFLQMFKRKEQARSHVNSNAVNGVENGDGGGMGSLSVAKDFKGFVTSEALLLFTPGTTPNEPDPHEPAALSIPYPLISLHATQRLLQSPGSSKASTATYCSLTSSPSAPEFQEVQAIYLQLSPSNPEERDPTTDEDDEATVELFVVPRDSSSSSSADADADADGSRSSPGNAEQVRELFEALSRCADLHSDTGVMGEGEDGDDVGGALSLGGLGGGQWITSENMHEFEGEFDGEDEENEVEEGSEEEVEQGGEGLGPGAGTRRALDPNDEDEAEVEETKWQRTA